MWGCWRAGAGEELHHNGITGTDVHQVSKAFGGFQALNDVSLQVGAGERFGLIGPNGSGKSTLINIIAGSLRGDMGIITFNGREISGLPAYQRARLGIARSFQIPQPFVSMTVLDNVCIPLAFGTQAPASQAEEREEARRLLDLVGLTRRAAIKPGGLTQIELRQLELARALAVNPKLLLLDEVLAGLASVEIDDILALLQELNQRGIAIIMIEHIMRAVMGFSERVAVLDAGAKIAEGTPDEVIRMPEVERAYLGE